MKGQRQQDARPRLLTIGQASAYILQPAQLHNMIFVCVVSSGP